MQDYIKHGEKEYNYQGIQHEGEQWIRMVDHIEISRRNEIATIIGLLEHEVERLEKQVEPNWSIMLETGSEYTTPRMSRSIGYNTALSDIISYYKEQIKLLK